MTGEFWIGQLVQLVTNCWRMSKLSVDSEKCSPSCCHPLFVYVSVCLEEFWVCSSTLCRNLTISVKRRSFCCYMSSALLSQASSVPCLGQPWKDAGVWNSGCCACTAAWVGVCVSLCSRPSRFLLDAHRGLGQACPDHRTQLVRRVYGMPLLC